MKMIFTTNLPNLDRFTKWFIRLQNNFSAHLAITQNLVGNEDIILSLYNLDNSTNITLMVVIKNACM